MDSKQKPLATISMLFDDIISSPSIGNHYCPNTGVLISHFFQFLQGDWLPCASSGMPM
jgi:hypothetical protein